MRWENLKEQIIEAWNSIWDRIRESDAFIKLKEKYQNLSPLGQRTAIGVSGLFVALFFLAVPLLFFFSSSESVEIFESNVRLLRNLYRVQRELAATPMVPDPPNSSSVSGLVQNIVNQAGLTPEQINGPREISPERDSSNALQPTGIEEHGVEITLMKLNVRQVADIGTRLSQMGQGLHLTALDMRANSQNDHYFDVIFRITGFTMPSSASGPQEKEEPGDKPARPSGGRG